MGRMPSERRGADAEAQRGQPSHRRRAYLMEAQRCLMNRNGTRALDHHAISRGLKKIVGTLQGSFPFSQTSRAVSRSLTDERLHSHLLYKILRETMPSALSRRTRAPSLAKPCSSVALRSRLTATADWEHARAARSSVWPTRVLSCSTCNLEAGRCKRDVAGGTPSRRAVHSHSVDEALQRDKECI